MSIVLGQCFAQRRVELWMIVCVPVRQEPVCEDWSNPVAREDQRAAEIDPWPEFEHALAARIDIFCGKKIQIALADLERISDIRIDRRLR
jgi:hypothetical protein